MKPFSLLLNHRLVRYERPQVMAIINVTPDSFYDKSRTYELDSVRQRVRRVMEQGADFIDVGGYSSRPGAADVSPSEETDRLAIATQAIKAEGCQLPISVDTFRASVAHTAISEMGFSIVNDISGGTLDPEMFTTVAALQVPYILMHLRGTPQNMQEFTNYPDGVTVAVLTDLAEKIDRLDYLGVSDVIVDPGFGFAKTLEQNYQLAHNLNLFEKVLGRPVLAGISRKSMITRLLDIPPSDALEATTALNALLLDRGAAFLRVHDVKAARQCVDIYTAVAGNSSLIIKSRP